MHGLGSMTLVCQLKVSTAPDQVPGTQFQACLLDTKRTGIASGVASSLGHYADSGSFGLMNVPDDYIGWGKAVASRQLDD
jgi:hypothetical protein